MCGVIGYYPISPTVEVPAAFARLFQESTIRGLHAFGLAQPAEEPVYSQYDVVRSHNMNDVLASFKPGHPAVAHARYCTSGDWLVLANNQPIVVGRFALAFNGVIHMGTKEEFEAAFGVKTQSDNDGEVLIQRMLAAADADEAAKMFVRTMTGSFAGCWLDNGSLRVLRNERRPLWHCRTYGAHWWASTRDIFQRAGFPTEDLFPVPENLLFRMSRDVMERRS